MKYIIFTIIAVGVLAYYGFLNINTSKLESAAKQGINKVTSITKNVATGLVETASNSLKE